MVAQSIVIQNVCLITCRHQHQHLSPCSSSSPMSHIQTQTAMIQALEIGTRSIHLKRFQPFDHLYWCVQEKRDPLLGKHWRVIHSYPPSRQYILVIHKEACGGMIYCSHRYFELLKNYVIDSIYIINI